jgi:hypothetical protein
VPDFTQQRRKDGKNEPNADGIEHDGRKDDNEGLVHGFAPDGYAAPYEAPGAGPDPR